ncbi:uncharacterized protein BDV17DRAFT_44794 [Aspergillus undulatus]|uniref:uncharacterized protein n=1 Tax=Aspergillus undulatus TaxID=1810928 RepID=UPI003CCE11B8
MAVYFTLIFSLPIDLPTYTCLYLFFPISYHHHAIHLKDGARSVPPCPARKLQTADCMNQGKHAVSTYLARRLGSKLRQYTRYHRNPSASTSAPAPALPRSSCFFFLWTAKTVDLGTHAVERENNDGFTYRAIYITRIKYEFEVPNNSEAYVAWEDCVGAGIVLWSAEDPSYGLSDFTFGGLVGICYPLLQRLSPLLPRLLRREPRRRE